MIIEKVTNHYQKEGHPSEIWSNLEHDKARRTECLCRLCDRKNDDKPYSSCPVAAKIFKICLEDDMAMSITRCGATDDRRELMYRPLRN